MYLGMDVCRFQGNIDWDKVKASGIKFVIFQSTYGKNSVDEKFHKYIKEAIRVGLHIGIYHFIYATDVDYAIANAKNCLKNIEPYRDHIDLGVWCDYEGDSDRYFERKGLKVPSDEFKFEMVRAFCYTIREAGYPCGLYVNQYYLWLLKKLGTDTPLWYAHYCSQKNHDKLNRGDIMWQYSASGAVPGINGRVDMNYYYGELKGEVCANPYPIPTRTIKLTLPRVSGEDVKWLQYELNERGANLAIDGKCGPKTADAIERYQHTNRNELKVDGKCGANTRQHLLTHH